MNVLFLTLSNLSSFQAYGIYSDLLREFVRDGHTVYCISPVERRTGIKTHFEEDGKLLKLKILNIQKTNVIEKGISTLLIDYLFKRAVKRFFMNVKFDLVLYSTPPITFVKTIEYVKERDHATTYLMLKDIFPQNALDLGMLKKTGWKGFLYRYFRRKEKSLYDLSDKIGCMSPANIQYVADNNPSVKKDKLELCPNCIDYQDISLSAEEKIELRKKNGIPTDKIVFVYGGNLGKPQGIPFLIESIKSQINNNHLFFLIVGMGTEYNKIGHAFHQNDLHNAKLMSSLPKDDYVKLIAACDVGLIYLDYRFTIPNFPSRLLSYMQAKLPVLACTDIHSDIRETITDGKFGWWCQSNDLEAFSKCLSDISNADLRKLGYNAFKFMQENYISSHVYQKMSIHNIFRQ